MRSSGLRFDQFSLKRKLVVKRDFPPEAVMAQSLAELRSTSIEEVVRTYDEIAAHTQLDLNFYREEIARRDAAKQTARIIEMTQQMRTLTVVIAILTLLNSVFVAVPLLR